MDKLLIQSKDGAQAEIFHDGAHLSSWIPASGKEQLFLSKSSGFGEGVAIRGGVPVVFPQFAGFGVLPKHGFARNSKWTLEHSGQNELGQGIAVFSLQECIASILIWPHVFRAELTVTLSGEQLQIQFSVKNNGDTAFQFTTALHTYFRVDDIANTSLVGLQNLSYRDTVIGDNHCRQTEEILNIVGEVDRIYENVSAPILIQQEHQTLEIRQSGFQDAVVWNPGAEKAAQLKDLEPEGYRRMVCVEAASIVQPIQLRPGQTWSGVQMLHLLSAANS